MVARVFSFDGQLAMSKRQRDATDMEIIKQHITGCVAVRRGTLEEDRAGIDYVATLSSGVSLHIDAKTRERGASRFWKYRQPELALETWSVMPQGEQPGKIGWTLDQQKRTDLVLYTFDPSDSDYFYILPFQLLRITFNRELNRWLKQFGPPQAQCTEGRWRSECVFVPVGSVLDAVRATSVGTLASIRANPEQTKARNILAELAVRGIELELNRAKPGRIWATPITAVTDSDRLAINRYRPHILALLAEQEA